MDDFLVTAVINCHRRRGSGHALLLFCSSVATGCDVVGLIYCPIPFTQGLIQGAECNLFLLRSEVNSRWLDSAPTFVALPAGSWLGLVLAPLAVRILTFHMALSCPKGTFVFHSITFPCF